MKTFILSLMAVLMITGCTSSTPHGECIGITATEDPKMNYDYSTRNIIVGVIFSETIVVPLVVVFGDLKCPVSVK